MINQAGYFSFFLIHPMYHRAGYLAAMSDFENRYFFLPWCLYYLYGIHGLPDGAEYVHRTRYSTKLGARQPFAITADRPQALVFSSFCAATNTASPTTTNQLHLPIAYAFHSSVLWFLRLLHGFVRGAFRPF